MTHLNVVEHLDDAMRECIANCSDCHEICVATVQHCLELGGAHASPDHIRTLLDCAQACDTCRDFMLRGSDLHPRFCGDCAEACERCAQSCERVGADDDLMRECVAICRRCAETCRAMAA
jgi:hypothetical protein